MTLIPLGSGRFADDPDTRRGINAMRHQNSVFHGGVAKTHDHDAVMRISGESSGAAGPFCGTAKARYLPRYTATSDHDRTFTVSLENADIGSL
jgi:hypothetical protein